MPKAGDSDSSSSVQWWTLWSLQRAKTVLKNTPAVVSQTNAQSLQTYQITPQTCFLHIHSPWNVSVEGGKKDFKIQHLRNSILFHTIKCRRFWPHPDRGCNGVKMRQTWWNKRTEGWKCQTETDDSMKHRLLSHQKFFFKSSQQVRYFKSHSMAIYSMQLLMIKPFLKIVLPSCAGSWDCFLDTIAFQNMLLWVCGCQWKPLFPVRQ